MLTKNILSWNFFSTKNITELEFPITNFRKCCAKVKLMTPISVSPSFINSRLLYLGFFCKLQTPIFGCQLGLTTRVNWAQRAAQHVAVFISSPGPVSTLIFMDCVNQASAFWFGLFWLMGATSRDNRAEKKERDGHLFSKSLPGSLRMLYTSFVVSMVFSPTEGHSSDWVSLS